MNLKKPLTFEEQVNQLKVHGMKIDDDLITFLNCNNYYRLIGYTLQFRKNINDSDFKDPVSFNFVKYIYLFDEEIRNILRRYIEKIELFYRTQISYHFSLIFCKDPPHNQHYISANYGNSYQFNDVISDFNSNCRRFFNDTNVVLHHLSKYGNKFPLWVIVELLSFSDLTKLFFSMKDETKDYIAKKLNTGRKTIKNHLSCISALRNKCAHCERLYNIDFKPPAKLGKKFLKKHPYIKNNSLFAYILIVKKRLFTNDLKNQFVSDILELVDKYKRYIDFSLINFPYSPKNIFADILKNY